jgi:hypothetical protein
MQKYGSQKPGAVGIFSEKVMNKQSILGCVQSIRCQNGFILESDIPFEHRFKVESEWIKLYRNHEDADLVNYLDQQGGTLLGTGRGRKQPPEETEKRRQSNTGKKRSPEARKNMSEAKKGKPGRQQSDEIRAKISTTLKGRSSPTTGMKFSSETKAKMSASQKIRRSIERSRDINLTLGSTPWTQDQPLWLD